MDRQREVFASGNEKNIELPSTTDAHGNTIRKPNYVTYRKRSRGVAFENWQVTYISQKPNGEILVRIVHEGGYTAKVIPPSTLTLQADGKISKL